MYVNDFQRKVNGRTILHLKKTNFKETQKLLFEIFSINQLFNVFS